MHAKGTKRVKYLTQRDDPLCHVLKASHVSDAQKRGNVHYK